MAFISVLVVACTETAPVMNPTADPTPRPITLTLQGSPGAPPATARPTLVAVTATPDESAPAAIDIAAPACFDTLGDGYQCLGLARNATGGAHGTVLLHVALYDHGEIVETRTFPLERRAIAPDESVPYRLLFDHAADGPLVLDFDAAYAPDRRLVPLAVRDATGAMDGTDYTVSAILVNESGKPVTQIRALAVLFDGEHMAGFRIVEIDGLQARGTAAVNLRWYRLPKADYRFILSADALAETPP